MPLLNRVARWGPVNARRERRQVAHAVERLSQELFGPVEEAEVGHERLPALAARGRQALVLRVQVDQQFGQSLIIVRPLKKLGKRCLDL